MLSSKGLCNHPQVYVIFHRAMLLSKGLCYLPCGGIFKPMFCPQSFVIVHVVVFSDPCYCPQSYVIAHRGMFSSTKLCYHPQSYVIVHVVVFSDLCYRPHSYIFVHRGMLLCCRAGICSSVFRSNLLVFCRKMSEWVICSKKWAIHSFAHFWWAT